MHVMSWRGSLNSFSIYLFYGVVATKVFRIICDFLSSVPILATVIHILHCKGSIFLSDLDSMLERTRLNHEVA